MTHNLKTIQPFFERVWNNEKTFEVRYNDRDFQTGDTVNLKEYNEATNTYSGREVYCRIAYILNNFCGLSNGFVAFSIAVIDCIDQKNENDTQTI